MQRVELEVKTRDLGQKKANSTLGALRRDGWIPGTLYGHGDAVSIAVNLRELEKAVHASKAGLNSLFTVKSPGETTLAVIKEVQRHYLRQNPIHLDFQRINVKEKLEVAVPTHTVGESPGVKNGGGILEQITREIRARCLPDDIPATIDIDISKLEVGHAIKVKDLPPLNGVEYLTPPETIIVNVVTPKVEEVAAPAAGAATGAEPEVIAKGKKDEEGAAAAAPAAGGKGAPAAGGKAPAAGGKAPAAAPAAKKDDKKK